jgi:hypothetical protein
MEVIEIIVLIVFVLYIWMIFQEIEQILAREKCMLYMHYFLVKKAGKLFFAARNAGRSIGIKQLLTVSNQIILSYYSPSYRRVGGPNHA